MGICTSLYALLRSEGVFRRDLCPNTKLPPCEVVHPREYLYAYVAVESPHFWEVYKRF